MRFLALCSLVLFATMTTQAQYGFITGKVHDKFGPLSDVNVNIKDTPYGSYTDTDGYFAFELDTGLYELTVALSGYQSSTKIIELQNLDQIEVDFELESEILDAQVSLGSKSLVNQRQLQSPVPVDVVYGKDLLQTGRPDLAQALHYLLPNFFSVRQSTAEGSDFVDPISLRGLAPDQVLILVNGKRRHKSAFLHVTETFGKGTAGTDLNAIPIIAVDRIEILRDGASSQYGSDAIAGVINIILKEKTGTARLIAQAGSTTDDGGTLTQLSFNNGFSIRKRGYFNFSGTFHQLTSINRSEAYSGTIFGDERDADTDEREAFFGQTGFDGSRISEVGNPAIRDAALFYNAAFELTDHMDFYTFGGFSYRNGQSHSIYRFPDEQALVVPELYPLGFSPEVHADISDASISMGLRGDVNDWFLDFNFNQGSNQFDLSVFNSNNASMGIASPISAFAGGFRYGHRIFSFDATRSFVREKSHFEWSLGSVFRLENYDMLAGETGSFTDGGAITADGQPKAVGIQGYHGVHNDAVLEEIRSNAAAYVELDYELNERLMLEGAMRYESYSDFGDHFNYKFAGRYKVAEPFTVRASYSTGFKAPSLPQLYYRRTSTLFVDGELVEVVNFNSESSIRRLLDLEPLDPELSENISIGVTSSLTRNVSLSVDAYRINVKDRIVLSSRIDPADLDNADVLQLVPSGSLMEFFLNGLDTRTTGLDALLAFRFEALKGSFNLNTMYSRFVTERMGDIKVANSLAGRGELVFDREDEAGLETYVPQERWWTQLKGTWERFSLMVNIHYFGSVTSLHLGDENPDNWVVNDFSREAASRDQQFASRTIVNLEASVRLTDAIDLTLGVFNLLNTYPERHTHSANQAHGVYPYSVQARQFDLTGRYIYGRMSFRF